MIRMMRYGTEPENSGYRGSHLLFDDTGLKDIMERNNLTLDDLKASAGPVPAKKEWSTDFRVYLEYEKEKGSDVKSEEN